MSRSQNCCIVALRDGSVFGTLLIMRVSPHVHLTSCATLFMRFSLQVFLFSFHVQLVARMLYGVSQLQVTAVHEDVTLTQLCA